MEEKKQNEEVVVENNFEEVPIYQEVETKKKEVRTDSYFDGGVLELIGWRILAFLITVVTLGLANPWAQCMLYSWQFKHTVYNGKRLKFEGTGGDLFVNMFKWIFFSIITLGIYILFIPVRKARWVVSNLHYEDEDFVRDESFFDGKTIQYIGINILSKILTVCSLGLLFPFVICLRLRWINKHSVINRKKVVFDGNGFQLWGKYILWCFLTIITFGIFGFWLPIRMLKWQTKHIHIKTVGEEEKKDKSLYIIIPIAIVLVVVAVAVLGSIIPKISDGDFEEFTKNIKLPFGKNKVLDEKSISEEEAILSGLIQQSESKTPSKTVPETVSEPEPEPAKTSITVGGYTLKFGTYKGQIEQGVWDEETMSATSVFHNVVLKLTEDTITLDGETTGYRIIGTELRLNNRDFKVLEATGNNRITYYAETCPELVYQGY